MIDLLPNRKDYFTQTNNARDPINACQRTAAAQCLFILGEVDKIKGPYPQPEDNLDYLCNTDPDIHNFCLLSHGKAGIPPAPDCPVGNIIEWADVLCYTINKAVGYEAAYYSGYGIIAIIGDIDAGLPLMACMRYNYTPGHYVSVVGYDPGDEDIIIADPYKKSITGGYDGFHNVYTMADWTAHYKGYGIRFRRRSN